MRGASKSVHGHLVLWKSGIDTGSVELVPGTDCTLRYTYGWPSVLNAPENAGDLPTGIWADIDARADLLLLVK
jgi:hypothetical protein